MGEINKQGNAVTADYCDGLREPRPQQGQGAGSCTPPAPGTACCVGQGVIFCLQLSSAEEFLG